MRTFYSHVNYSVTKINAIVVYITIGFYSHVNYSVTKIGKAFISDFTSFTVT